VHSTDTEVDLKQAAKLFGKKFACGAAVSTLATGQDEITIQGDFSDQVVDMIPLNWKHVLPADIQLLETKKK
jgi:density-regulated protein DRP1